ncbi:MAG TPA: shikimate kinase [Anaerolineae bacterium]|nr:shikimate kinase [Anaerolineae bacterium]
MEIILIGPIGTGKSTVAELLSKRLNLPQFSMDDVRFDYYKEIGYDEEYANRKRQEEGLWAVYPYWKPFEAYAVERILIDHSNCIIDFGAGHSVYEDENLFERVQTALSAYPNVILLLPSADPDESVSILNEREEFLREMKPNINEHFIKHPSNHKLAKFIVYTKEKTPQETCDEILKLVKISV